MISTFYGYLQLSYTLGKEAATNEMCLFFFFNNSWKWTLHYIEKSSKGKIFLEFKKKRSWGHKLILAEWTEKINVESRVEYSATRLRKRRKGCAQSPQLLRLSM